MTAEQRDEQLEMVKWLIAEGRVSDWTQLGRTLGISRQAAQARFGADGYGLEMPNRATEKMADRVYLSLPAPLASRLDRATQGRTKTDFLRDLLDKHLPA